MHRSFSLRLLSLAAFVPLKEEVGPYTGLVVASVFIEEAVRYLVWRMHKCGQLKARARPEPQSQSRAPAPFPHTTNCPA